MKCECLEGCPFFNDKMKNKPSLAEIYKKQFCLGDNINCARHKVKEALGGDKVPMDMYPNQIEKAELLIANSKN